MKQRYQCCRGHFTEVERLGTAPDDEKELSCPHPSIERDAMGGPLVALCGMPLMETKQQPVVPNRKHAVVYDRDTDTHDGTNILMLRVQPEKVGRKLIKRTEEVVPGWIVDFDAEGQVIEIEILDPVAFPQAILDLLPPEFFPEEGT